MAAEQWYPSGAGSWLPPHGAVQRHCVVVSPKHLSIRWHQFLWKSPYLVLASAMLDFTADLGTPDCLYHSLEKQVLLERHFVRKKACGRSSVLHVQKQTSTLWLSPRWSGASYLSIPGREAGDSMDGYSTVLESSLALSRGSQDDPSRLSPHFSDVRWVQSCSICRWNRGILLLPCCSVACTSWALPLPSGRCHPVNCPLSLWA